MNATLESLRKIHGEKAESVFREIADKGGFGAVGDGDHQIRLSDPSGLDVGGVLAEGNTAISAKDKERIADLVGIGRKEADKHIEDVKKK